MSDQPVEIEAPSLAHDEEHPDDQKSVTNAEVESDLEDQTYVDLEGEDGPA